MSTTSTKSELLHEASRMVLARGLNGFSLQELATSLNIKKSSLFHYYPSKTALAVDLYRFYQEAFLAWVKRYEELPPEKQIINYAEKLTSWICEKQRVCPVGALSLEWHLVEPELQAEILKLHEMQKTWLTKLVRQMNLSIPKGDAVMGIMALIQGSIQLARLTDDSQLVVRNLKFYLKSVRV